jgi:hypothetical protein
MSKFTSPLDNIKIASPCSQDWDSMVGTDRMRFCGDCKLNVYNLSGMTRPEAESLLMNAEGRLCVRFFKRADGTILTDDCPVGWAAVKRRASRMAAAAVSMAIGIIGGLGFTSALSSRGGSRLIAALTTPTPIQLTGAVAPSSPAPKKTATPKPTPREYTVGELTVASPQPSPVKETQPLMGKVAVRKD